MAWLIALALFLWIGGNICKAADYQSGKKARKSIDLYDGQNEFVGSLYVLGWNHYQELEPVVLQSAQAAGLRNLCGNDLEKYSEALIGEPISQKAIAQALQELVDHGEQLFIHKENVRLSAPLLEKIIPIIELPSSYVDREAQAWEQEIKMDSGALHPFDQFFWMGQGYYIKSDWIKQQIPAYDDIRIYRNSLGYIRPGTPRNYEQEIKERRQLEQACAKAKANREVSMRQCTQTVRNPMPDENGLRRDILIQELRQTIRKIISLKQSHL